MVAIYRGLATAYAEAIDLERCSGPFASLNIIGGGRTRS